MKPEICKKCRTKYLCIGVADSGLCPLCEPLDKPLTTDSDTGTEVTLDCGVIKPDIELATLRFFIVGVSKGQCKCGIPPNDNGVNCDACQASILRETFKF